MKDGKKKVKKVMKKFEEGKLHSGSKKGPVVKDKAQALAIGYSEAGEKKEEMKYEAARNLIQSWIEEDSKMPEPTTPPTMLNKLWGCIDDQYGKIEVFTEILNVAQELITHFEDTKIAEGSKNAAIDAICEILQEHKDPEEPKK